MDWTDFTPSDRTRLIQSQISEFGDEAISRLKVQSAYIRKNKKTLKDPLPPIS